jgi:hypothetical protein
VLAQVLCHALEDTETVPDRLLLFHMDAPCTFEQLVAVITVPLDLSRLPPAERQSAEVKTIQQEFFDLATELLFHLLGLASQASWSSSPVAESVFNPRWFCGILEASPGFKAYFAHKIVEDLTRVRFLAKHAPPEAYPMVCLFQLATGRGAPDHGIRGCGPHLQTVFAVRPVGTSLTGARRGASRADTLLLVSPGDEPVALSVPRVLRRLSVCAVDLARTVASSLLTVWFGARPATLSCRRRSPRSSTRPTCPSTSLP